MTKVINASAGTGKTHYLINLLFKDKENKDRTYEDIIKIFKETVILSFSNAAVDELKRRIYYETIKRFNLEIKNIDDIRNKIFDIPLPRVFTIHSFVLELAKILKYDLGIRGDIELDLNDDYSIWDNACLRAYQEKNIYEKINEIFKSFKSNKSYSDSPTVQIDKIEMNLKNFIQKKGKILFLISEGFKITHLKNKNITNICDELNEKYEILKDICVEIGFKYYLPILYDSGVFEFDALLKIICDLFIRKKQELTVDEYNKWFKDRLERENFGFENLFVDEAQDNDIMQNFFIYSIIPEEINKIIVGDPKQSIYYFRNAVPAQFTRAFNEVKAIFEKNQDSIILNKSYRLKSKVTMNYINDVCKKIKQHFSDIWVYDEKIDNLVERDFKDEDEKLKFNNLNPKIELHLVDKAFTRNKILTKYPEIDEFLNDENSKIGILVRSRKDLKSSRIIEKLNQLGYKEKIKYKLSFDIKQELSEYYFNLLKMLIELIDEKNTKRTAMRFLFLDDSYKFLLNNICNIDVQDIDIISFLKEVRKKLDEKVKIFKKRKIAFSMVDILDGNSEENFWKYFCRIEMDISYSEIMRIINYVILKLWLEEVEYGAFSTNDAIKILEETNSPYEWYSVLEALGEERKTESVIEITTIHSSKGKSYNKVIIIANFLEELREEPNLSSNKDGPIFEHMFSFEFKKVITDFPEIELGVFPYFGKDLINNLKNNTIELDWLKKIYLNLKKDVISQNLNLLYVALTRTEKDLILLGHIPQDKIPYKIFDNRYITKKCYYIIKQNSTEHQNISKIYILNKTKKEINLAPPVAKRYIGDLINIKLKERVKDIFEINKRNKVNILVHNILYNILEKVKDEKEYNELIDKYALELKEIAPDIINRLKQQSINILKKFEGKSDFRSDMHIFQMDENGFLKGNVEIIFFDRENKIVLTEIKTVFDNYNENIENAEKYAEEELNIYEKMIKKLNDKDEIEKNKIII
ncbi:MAG: UvrD-helicase domain-containing protein [Candidatus Goldbacteria bacterium]|nr:UvrD-helicase domain-containing protein [Candidatus Goldiibacteriota bacterium]